MTNEKALQSQSQFFSPKDSGGNMDHYATVYSDDTVDVQYYRKARILNEAVQEIGMGRYQWGLFIVTGFGWFADNLWPIVTGLILPPTVNEFNYKAPYLKLGQNIGLLLGAAFWGIGADVWGRKISYNLTMLIIAIFAIAAGGSPNFIALSSFAALWSVGVGGNLPVDSAIFLEFIPGSHQYLLTVLSIWWAFGQLVGSLRLGPLVLMVRRVAWPLIANFSCTTSVPGENCPKSSNMGWRYFLFTMGALMFVFWVLRFFVFKLYESPKFLMGKKDDARAVEIIHHIADYNKKTSHLTLRDLEDVDRESQGNSSPHVLGEVVGGGGGKGRSIAVIRRQLSKFDANHVKTLFSSRKLAYSSTLLIILWALIGLAFPLYNSFLTYYLSTRGASFGDSSVYITYRNQVILSVIAIPGALLAGYMVEIPLLGRRGTLSVSTDEITRSIPPSVPIISYSVLTGVFILASTTARTSNSLLAWNCAYSFTSNVMYGVLYAITPELFPTKDRGTGNALTATANRIFGIMAPIIALSADLTTSVPIFIAGAIFLIAGAIALLLPFETRGRASL